MATRPKPNPDSDTLRAILGQLEELNRHVAAIAERLPSGAGSQAEGASYDPARDPGSVPPGVAPVTPAPLTAEDKKARRALERLPSNSRSRAKTK